MTTTWIPRDGFPAGVTYKYNPVDIIQPILDNIDESCYLEIGVDEGNTFDKINATVKHGVDPYGASPSITHKMTSQMFFAMNKYFWHHQYDVIFLDGCHMAEVIIAEIMQALYILKPLTGVVVLHDTVPVNEEAQLVLEEDYEAFFNNVVNGEKTFRQGTNERTWRGYNGDTWKAVAALRRMNPTMPLATVTAACTTVLYPFLDQMVSIPPLPDSFGEMKLDWDTYVDHGETILNLASYENFIEVNTHIYARLREALGEK
jgi:hypothetical protein